ncbi:hypothetical protein [Nocardioides sp. GY 10127]|uniref:hypothetical protein n=1 Tax=Nocardioides sp. GY 10127 TaxID=2569762 RepID=UPI0010A7BA26|nr:hypothetical protein [Nocardioides sp. GY 10127]TIC85586.1 hypothetical protein E8D37_02900 [Nocardioides sp. GY 10127]
MSAALARHSPSHRPRRGGSRIAPRERVRLPLPLVVGLAALVLSVVVLAFAVGLRLLGVGVSGPVPVAVAAERGEAGAARAGGAGTPGAAAAQGAATATATPGATGSRAASAADTRARQLVTAWDARRAVAWAASDPLTLRRLYERGSSAGRADVAMLRAWQDRGLRVADLDTRVLAVESLVDRPRLVRVRVTDQLAGGTVERVRTGAATGQTLPGDEPTTRVLVLVRQTRGWVVREVRRAS